MPVGVTRQSAVFTLKVYHAEDLPQSEKFTYSKQEIYRRIRIASPAPPECDPNFGTFLAIPGSNACPPPPPRPPPVSQVISLPRYRPVSSVIRSHSYYT